MPKQVQEINAIRFKIIGGSMMMNGALIAAIVKQIIACGMIKLL